MDTIRLHEVTQNGMRGKPNFILRYFFAVQQNITGTVMYHVIPCNRLLNVGASLWAADGDVNR